MEGGLSARSIEPMQLRREDCVKSTADVMITMLMNVFFDVLDTLLSEEDVLRPHAREVFQELEEMGHEVYLWSSGGGAYAAAAADLLRVADLVKGCFGKTPRAGGRSRFRCGR